MNSIDKMKAKVELLENTESDFSAKADKSVKALYKQYVKRLDRVIKALGGDGNE